MADDGLHLGLQEGAALRVVIQGTELLHKQRTALYPAVEGLHCSIGGAARLVKQSQLGLAVRTWCEHDYDDFMIGDSVILTSHKDTEFQTDMQTFPLLFFRLQDI